MSYVLLVSGAVSRVGAYYGQGEGAILLDSFFCDGTEDRLTDCSHQKADLDRCSHANDAGVECTSKSHFISVNSDL